MQLINQLIIRIRGARLELGVKTIRKVALQDRVGEPWSRSIHYRNLIVEPITHFLPIAYLITSVNHKHKKHL
jgi:hypothetical protein